MARFRGNRTAFGWPGEDPRWTEGNKDGVGTSLSLASRVWFTLSRGILTEVYYPTVDRPQVRDLQFLITDGESFFHPEKCLESETRPLSLQSLGYQTKGNDPDGRYQITKEIVTDPNLPCVLIRTSIEATGIPVQHLRVYAHVEPRLGGRGWGNNAFVAEVGGRELLVAENNGIWLAMAATVPFRQLTCGYVGRSDGWTDLSDNYRLDWEFDQALEGHVAMTGELDWTGARDFTLGLSFGDGLQSAVVTLFQSLGVPWSEHRHLCLKQWHREARQVLPLEHVSTDTGFLFRRSYSLLRAHEDKTFPGALIASLSVPWGEERGDDGSGGYHLVWTRDLVHCATGLLAAGDTSTARRALIYLAGTQQVDGGFPENFWINGEPHWQGVQLDEVAFPILLAWRLDRENALSNFDPMTMVLRAASYLIHQGPATEHDRWEEASGYSPSTLATNIAALICAADLIRRHLGDQESSRFIEEYADFLECHVEPWTVTTDGTLSPDIKRHFIRIHPVNIADLSPDENPNYGLLTIANRPPGTQRIFPAKEIVDPGFLELVRLGIRRADDPVIMDSLRLVDSLLRVETPFGPCWRRYNQDGYGQRPDGGPYVGWGQGRPWPLLTGERAHYELALGQEIAPFIGTMERFASPTGMLPEQIWDESDRPEMGLYRGYSTGAAMPLMWAHAEYIRLLRSVHDKRVFDLVEPVQQRYLGDRNGVQKLEIWKPNRQVTRVRKGMKLRVQAPGHFCLRWSADNWQTIHDSLSEPTALGISFVDIPVSSGQQSPLRFTFYWTDEGRWEGRDYDVAVTPGANISTFKPA